MALSWGQDLQVESELTRLGVKWSIVRPLKRDIDVKASRENNARLHETLNQDRCEEYACAMDRGTTFPRPVLHLPAGFNLYRVLSGNHRVGAVEFMIGTGSLSEDEAVVESYLLKTNDPMILDLITRCANRWQGQRQSREEAVEHAKWMMERYSMSIPELAGYFGLREEWLKYRLRAEDVRRTLKAQMVDADNLTAVCLQKIGQLAFNEPLMRKAGHMAVRFGMRADDIKTMVDQTKTAATAGEVQGVEALKQWERRLREAQAAEPAPNRGLKRGYRTRFLTVLGSLENLLLRGKAGQPFGSLEELQLTDEHDVATFRARWKAVKRLADSLFHAVQTTPAEGNGRPVQTRRRCKAAGRRG